MKKIIFILAIVFFALSVNAQDIVLESGRVIKLNIDQIDSLEIIKMAPSLSITTGQDDVYDIMEIPIKNINERLEIKFYFIKKNIKIVWVSLYNGNASIICSDLMKNEVFAQNVVSLLEKIEKFSSNWFVEENDKKIQKTGILPEKYKIK